MVITMVITMVTTTVFIGNLGSSPTNKGLPSYRTPKLKDNLLDSWKLWRKHHEIGIFFGTPCSWDWYIWLVLSGYDERERDIYKYKFIWYIIICIHTWERERDIYTYAQRRCSVEGLQLCIPLGRPTKVLGNIKIPPLLNSAFKWEDQQRY